MFDVGGSEIIVVLLLILLLFKPQDIPVIMKKAGFWLRKLRSYTHSFMENIMEEPKDKVFTGYKEINPKIKKTKK